MTLGTGRWGAELKQVMLLTFTDILNNVLLMLKLNVTTIAS